MSAGVPIGFTLGGLLASRLVQLLGWPAIFMMGGVLPFAIIPVLALWLPESVITRASTSRGNPVIALFADRLAPCTVLLWAMNFFNLFANFVILLWTPAILHSTGVSASRSIFGTWGRHHPGGFAHGARNGPAGRRAGADIYDRFRRFMCSGDRFGRYGVLVALNCYLWRRNGHWQLPNGSQLTFWTDLSAGHPLDGSRLGTRLGTDRCHCRTSHRRCAANPWVSRTGDIPRGFHSGHHRSCTDGDPRAVAALKAVTAKRRL
jgi:MFS family permease